MWFIIVFKIHNILGKYNQTRFATTLIAILIHNLSIFNSTILEVFTFISYTFIDLDYYINMCRTVAKKYNLKACEKCKLFLLNIGTK